MPAENPMLDRANEALERKGYKPTEWTEAQQADDAGATHEMQVGDLVFVARSDGSVYEYGRRGFDLMPPDYEDDGLATVRRGIAASRKNAQEGLADQANSNAPAPEDRGTQPREPHSNAPIESPVAAAPAKADGEQSVLQQEEGQAGRRRGR